MKQSVSQETREFAENLKKEIQDKYKSSKNELGWRLLYSPLRVLDGAEIAFIGLHPGGDSRDPGRFATEDGKSAYRDESWAGKPPGEDKFQKQALALFEKVGVERENAHNVLAGNLILFRSPTMNKLSKKSDAVKFGEKIWGEIFSRQEINPHIVITAGREVRVGLEKILNVKNCNSIKLDIADKYKREGAAEWGKFGASNGKFLALPCLSLFKNVKDDEWEEQLEKIFRDY